MNELGKRAAVFGLVALALACAQPANPDAPSGSAASAAPQPRMTEGVTGRVTNASGAPIARASVVARSLDDSGPPIPEIAIESDDEGRYEWPLRPGNYELTFVADGHERTTRTVVVSRSAVATVDVRLQPAR